MVRSFPEDGYTALQRRQALIVAAQAGDALSQSELPNVYRIGDEYTKQA